MYAVFKMPNDDFTYQKPDDQAFLVTLIECLKSKNEKELLGLLEGARCSIESSSSFSYKRWNGLWTAIHFYVPIHKLKLVNKDIEQKLIAICDWLMPAEVGFDVMAVEFSPLIPESVTQQTLIEDLENTALGLSREIIRQILPNDIKQKGKDMAEVYLYLYCVENSLRLFIEKVAREKLGNDYFNKLNLNNDIRKSISQRKRQENKNKWLRLRGDSEIFYLDFKDLGAIIQNNWSLFSPYFPNQSWILTKIDELAKCRNLVAHNSFIEIHEKNVIKVNYTSILKQLDITLKNQTQNQP